jgi:threonine/homoserine/homoserine lactone efflux protein
MMAILKFVFFTSMILFFGALTLLTIEEAVRAQWRIVSQVALGSVLTMLWTLLLAAMVE